MTKREIVKERITHGETELCPYTLDFEVDSRLEDQLDEFYRSPSWREDLGNYITKAPAMPDGRDVWKPGPAIRTDFFGTTWRMDLKPVHVETPALSEPDLSGYSFPAIDRFVTSEWRKDVERFVEENSDRFTVVYTGFGLFERSWMLRGFENALADAALSPEFYSSLLEAITVEYFDPLLDELLALPIDGIMFGDDWGDQRGVMIGPDRWRALLKPRYKRLYEKVRAAGKFTLNHVCGSVVDIIPDLVDIGLDVLESIQVEAAGMNPYDLKKRFGRDLCFWGALGSQTIIPFGTPTQLRTEIRRLASDMSVDGGYILSCSKALQAGTPVENAAAIVEEFVAAGASTSMAG